MCVCVVCVCVCVHELGGTVRYTSCNTKVGWGDFEQDGVSKHGTAFRLYAVEQLPFCTQLVHESMCWLT